MRLVSLDQGWLGGLRHAVLFMLFIQVHFSVRYLKRRVCIIFSYDVAFAICHCLGSAFPKG